MLPIKSSKIILEEILTIKYIFMDIYVNNSNPPRMKLLSSVLQLNERDPYSPVVIIGDWDASQSSVCILQTLWTCAVP